MRSQHEFTQARTSEVSNQQLVDYVNPCVFLVGTPRSGTTMLKRMVNAHPLIAITRETHWIPRHYEKQNGVDHRGHITPEIVSALFEYYRFEQMKVERDRLAEFVALNPRTSYALLVTFIFDCFALRKHKPIVGDKTPCYVAKIPLLHSLWPQAKFVHLIRDGREVCLSMLKWRMAQKNVGRFSTWATDPIVTVALWWKALVGIGRQDGAALGQGQYLEVFYDSLVVDNERICRQVTDLLQIDYHDNMKNYYVGRTQSGEHLSTNEAWLPPTAGLRDWRAEMKSEDVAKFAVAAGDLLEQLGYESGCVRISDSIRQHVARVREQFRREALERKWRLPDIW